MTGKTGNISPRSDRQDEILSEMAPHPTESYEESVRSLEVVQFLKRVLPFIAGALLILMLIWPFLNNTERKFTLSVEKLEKRDRSLRVVKPQYSGIDNKGRPFEISAETAVQTYDDGMQVSLEGLDAYMDVQPDVRLAVTAAMGQYDAGTSQLFLEKAITLTSTDGYEFQAGGALVYLSKGIAEGDKGVTGKAPFGAFSADKFWADVGEEELKFEGHVMVRIDPAAVPSLPSPEAGPAAGTATGQGTE